MKIRGLYIWVNLLIMAIVVVLIVLGVGIWLNAYTRHNEAIKVPDVRRMSVSDARYALEQAGLYMEVGDTGYVRMQPTGCVLEQSVDAGSIVKSGKIVRVTINSGRTPTLAIPDVIDNCSYREARARLTSMGFKVGEPQPVAGERDWVYGIKVRGRNVVAGEKVSVEDWLTIQVGSGSHGEDDDINFVDDDEFLSSDDELLLDDLDEI